MSQTVTRAYLAQIISDEIGLSASESVQIIDLLFESIVDHFTENNSLKIISFGSFHLKAKKERIGRNPRTKEEAIVSARNVISFHPSRKLKALINETPK